MNAPSLAPEPPTLLSRLDRHQPRPVSAELAMQLAGWTIIRHQAKALLVHEAGTIAGVDPEELHDMRVASRRLRAAVRVFGAAYGSRLTGFRRDLPLVTRALGRVRDIDVFLEHLAATIAAQRVLMPEHLPPLTEYLALLRDRQRSQMVRAFSTLRYDRLKERLVSFVEHGPATRSRLPGAMEPVSAAAPPMIRRRLAQVLVQGRAIGPEVHPEALHALRIRFKKLRYTMEFFKPAFGTELAAFIHKAVELQDLLGDYHDTQVAQATILRYLRSRSGRRAPALSRSAVAEVLAGNLVRGEELRASFRRVWLRFDDRAARHALYRELGLRAEYKTLASDDGLA